MRSFVGVLDKLRTTQTELRKISEQFLTQLLSLALKNLR